MDTPRVQIFNAMSERNIYQFEEIFKKVFGGVNSFFLSFFFLVFSFCHHHPPSELPFKVIFFSSPVVRARRANYDDDKRKEQRKGRRVCSKAKRGGKSNYSVCAVVGVRDGFACKDRPVKNCCPILVPHLTRTHYPGRRDVRNGNIYLCRGHEIVRILWAGKRLALQKEEKKKTTSFLTCKNVCELNFFFVFVFCLLIISSHFFMHKIIICSWVFSQVLRTQSLCTTVVCIVCSRSHPPLIGLYVHILVHLI